MSNFNGPYEEGKAASLSTRNPYITTFRGGYREDRMEREVAKRRWDAGFQDEPDPYPNGWAG